MGKWSLLAEIAHEESKSGPVVLSGPRWTLDDLMIQTKDGRLIALGQNLNEVQEKILRDVCPKWRQGDYSVRGGVRAYELKARQFGVSTLYLALYFLEVINRSDFHAVVIADNDDNTEALFQKAHIFYENLREGERPRKKFSNRRELAFADLRSTFRVLTAGRKGAGRSRTIQRLHCSEVAFWRNAQTVMSGLMQAVPYDGCITIESTANGEGSEDDEGNLVGAEGAFFHVQYQKAKQEENGFEARFTPWYALSSYRADPPLTFQRINPTLKAQLISQMGQAAGEAKYTSLTRRYLLEEYTEGEIPSEDEYARRFDLTDSQLYWRRCKIDEPGQGPLFRQEYPTTEDEAFLLSGASFFTAWNEAEHVVPKRPVPDWWDHRGGYDWGQLSPASFHVGAWAPNGDVEIYDEVYKAGCTEEQFADLMIEMLQQRGYTMEGGWWGLKPADRPWKRLTIYADPSIFPNSDPLKRVGVSRAEKFWSKGLYFVKAENDRATTNANARSYMQRQGALKVQRTCANLIRTIPQARRDPKDPTDFVLIEDHAIDSGARYLLSCRPMQAEEPDDVARRREEQEIEARLRGMDSIVAGGLGLGNIRPSSVI